MLANFSISGNEETDDYILGNKWYSKQIFYSRLYFESGFSGTKDYLNESFLFKYSFKSKNRHQFNIRFFHNGFSTGIYSNNFKFFNFSIKGGFEYLYKIFSNLSGIYLWLDVGGCNEGFSFNTGFGVGDRYKSFFQLEFNFLNNISIDTNMDFNFFLFNFFNIGGKVGILIGYRNLLIDFFCFKNCITIGFTIKEIFNISIGGGFTINDYFFFNGVGIVFMSLKI
ncbi:MAG TPA: hypothetical protein PLE45_06590 [Spirochaetota bacterium]|nr:hypothetical protein [Spirochaetota bacterium]HOL56944.1 hypothetical protein [Spirochaetota bacterium]HPP04480.1 hypothetical protein [Spirochaetota bacterium]